MPPIVAHLHIGVIPAYPALPLKATSSRRPVAGFYDNCPSNTEPRTTVFVPVDLPMPPNHVLSAAPIDHPDLSATGPSPDRSVAGFYDDSTSATELLSSQSVPVDLLMATMAD